jgi:hypothetical protein
LKHNSIEQLAENARTGKLSANTMVYGHPNEAAQHKNSQQQQNFSPLVTADVSNKRDLEERGLTTILFFMIVNCFLTLAFLHSEFVVSPFSVFNELICLVNKNNTDVAKIVVKPM